jgi:hypothetical protein
MLKASNQVLFSAVAVSVCAFAAGHLGIATEHSRVLAAPAPEGASTLTAKPLLVAPDVMPLGLPDAKDAKAVLSRFAHPSSPAMDRRAVRGVHHPNVRHLSRPLRQAAIAVVTEQNQAMSDWARAVGTEMSKKASSPLVPDVLSGLAPNGGGADSFASREAVTQALADSGRMKSIARTRAVRDYFASQPGSNGEKRRHLLQLGRGPH